MVPGAAFFLLCVIVAVIIFVYIKPFKKAADLHKADHDKLENFITLLKANLDNEKVSDYAFREHIRQTLAIYEGREYKIPNEDVIEQGHDKDETVDEGKD